MFQHFHNKFQKQSAKIAEKELTGKNECITKHIKTSCKNIFSPQHPTDNNQTNDDHKW
jgi:hypothetical protein